MTNTKNRPTKVSLEVELENRRDLTDTEHQSVIKLIQSLNETEVDIEWLINTTEKFCKDKAVYNAIVDGIAIIDGKDGKRTQEAIPDIMRDALACKF